MLLLLIEDGFNILQDPVAKYIPEIQAAVVDLRRNSTKSRDGINFTKWNEVTVGELASYLAGIPRDCEYCFSSCWVSLGLPTRARDNSTTNF
jgi:CubicO group peptidase (beta-lactamase class C family)